MSSFHDLEVWRLGIELVKKIYVLTDSFPSKERFRLCDQMCRAVVSVPSNIAEGSARKSTKEFMRYVAISLGSLAEVRTQLIIVQELGYVSSVQLTDILALCEIIGKKMQALYASLERKK